MNGSEVAKQLDDPSNDRARYKGHPHGNGTGKAPSSKLKVNQEIFNGTAAKVVEPTRGRIWVCDVSRFLHHDKPADGIALPQVHEEQGELGSTFCMSHRPHANLLMSVVLRYASTTGSEGISERQLYTLGD